MNDWRFRRTVNLGKLSLLYISIPALSFRRKQAVSKHILYTEEKHYLYIPRLFALQTSSWILSRIKGSQCHTGRTGKNLKRLTENFSPVLLSLDCYIFKMCLAIYRSVLEARLIEGMGSLIKIYTCCLWEKTEIMISSIDTVVCQANFMSAQNG